MQVGDRVLVLKVSPVRLAAFKPKMQTVGMIGRVCAIEKYVIGVDFKTNVQGHTCENNCPSGQGWYYNPYQLKKI